MARSLRTLVLISACGALVAVCAHAAPPVATAGPDLPALGEDMPETVIAAPLAAPTKLLSVDTPVSKLCSVHAAKAVVDRDLPGLTTRPEYVFFKHMSLRQLQAASRGQMPIADLDKVAVDLEAIGQPATPFLRASAALP